MPETLDTSYGTLREPSWQEMALEWLRQKGVIGPTGTQREAMIEKPVRPIDLLNSYLGAVSIPQPVQQVIGKATDPVLNLLPPDLAGATKGIRDVAVSLPWGLGPLAPTLRSPALAQKAAATASKWLYGLWGGQTALNAPEAWRSSQRAYRQGDRETGSRILAQEIANAALLLASVGKGPGRPNEPQPPKPHAPQERQIPSDDLGQHLGTPPQRISPGPGSSHSDVPSRQVPEETPQKSPRPAQGDVLLSPVKAQDVEAANPPTPTPEAPRVSTVRGYIGTGEKVERFDPNKIRDQSEGYGVYIAPDLNEPVARSLYRGGKEGGQLNQVEIAVDPNLLLHLDEPLAHQPAVQGMWDRLRQQAKGTMWEKVLQNWLQKPNPKGSDLYLALRTMLGSNKAASEALLAAGIPGNQYYAQREGGPNRAVNYVIFDPGLIHKSGGMAAPQTVEQMAQLQENQVMPRTEVSLSRDVETATPAEGKTPVDLYQQQNKSGTPNAAPMPSVQLVTETFQKLRNAGISEEWAHKLMNHEIEPNDFLKEAVGYFTLGNRFEAKNLEFTRTHEGPRGAFWTVENKHPEVNILRLLGDSPFVIREASFLARKTDVLRELAKDLQHSLNKILSPLETANFAEMGISVTNLKNAITAWSEHSVNIADSNTFFIDPTGRVPQAWLREVREDHAMISLANAAADTFQNIQDLIGRRNPAYGRAQFGGFLYGPYAGLNIKPRALLRNINHELVLVNPFIIASQAQKFNLPGLTLADVVGHDMVITMIHELTHQIDRTHTKTFKQEMRELEKLMDENLGHASRNIERVLNQPWHKPIVPEGATISTYSNARTGTDSESQMVPTSLSNYERLIQIKNDLDDLGGGIESRRGDLLSKIGTRAEPGR